MREICLILPWFMALSGGSLFAQLAPPRIGLVSDRAGAVRTVLGVSGNFLVGDAVATSARSTGCSGTLSFVKTDTALSILDGVTEVDFPAPPGLAFFSFSGHTGFVYFLSDATLHHWDGANLSSVPLTAFDGTVAGLAQPDGQHVWFAVRRGDGNVSVLLLDGATGALQLSANLTGTPGSLALLNGQEFLYTNHDGFVLHRASGLEVSLPAPGVDTRSRLQFEQLGANWWSVKTKGQHFAIRTDPGREAVYQLPESTQ